MPTAKVMVILDVITAKIIVNSAVKRSPRDPCDTVDVIRSVPFRKLLLYFRNREGNLRGTDPPVLMAAAERQRHSRGLLRCMSRWDRRSRTVGAIWLSREDSI